MGTGGGGDVKLIGALSVWLGWKPTVLVVVVSTLIVLVGTVLIIGGSLLGAGFSRTKDCFAGQGKQTGQERSRRRVMAFAVPVALATWVLMLWPIVQCR